VESGVLGIYEEDRTYELRAGETLILSAGLKHGGTLDYEKDLRFYWLHFRPAGADAAGKDIELPRRSALRRPERLVELFRRFLDDQEAGPVMPERADALVTLMLLETLLSAPGGGASNERGESLAARAENIMLARFHESSFSASTLAAGLKCNPDYLNRVFRAARGKTVTDALQALRVKSVAKLLLDEKLNISEAALRSGFSDSAYMRRVFKKLRGMTPREHRNLHLRMHINTK
jgi:AraC-like DNA-binding protein